MPFSRDLASLKSKLTPVLVMPGREQWREKLAKVVDRIIVHGQGNETLNNNEDLIHNLENAVYNKQIIHLNYQGHDITIYPLGIVYHWSKREWYIIALQPETSEILEYRLSRINKLITGENKFTMPQSFNLKNTWEIAGE